MVNIHIELFLCALVFESFKWGKIFFFLRGGGLNYIMHLEHNQNDKKRYYQILK